MKDTFNLFRLVTGAVLIWAIGSCQKSTDVNSFDKWIEDGHISITAKGGDQHSKTVMQSNGDVFWSPNDSISVFYGTYNLGKFTGLNSEPTNVTVFRSDDTFAFGTISGASFLKFYGINPYSKDNAISGNSMIFTVPCEQKAVVGSFEPGSFPSVACSEDLELSFYNVCGGLRFKVVNKGITQVTFKGNNNEVLAGKVKVTFDENNCPKITEYLTQETEVSLICSEGFVPGEWYYISLLPATMTKGFTLDLSNATKTVSYVSDKNTEVKRSIFGVLSDVDKGLEFDVDWRSCDFIHKSLLLAVPNCAFSSIFVDSYNSLISEAITDSKGNIEVIQMFANGPTPTDGISSLLSLFNIYGAPFAITDYREKVYSSYTPYSTYQATANLYGTTGGFALKSYYNGNELNVEVSMYIKKADNYKLVVALVQDDSKYKISTNNGANSSEISSSYITKYVLTDILGDAVDAVSDDIILYRSYKKTISDEDEKKNLRVVAYLLRPYGSRDVVSNGNFGSCYVDNAFSVTAGCEAQLPLIVNINSEIIDFDYGGTIEF